MNQIFEKNLFVKSAFNRLIVPTDPIPFETNKDNFRLLSASRLKK